ncbi:hypothetical protein [Providencia heimbachae]|uniref:hypothetical protein n=1 Tax=Providencia heimbachae TaxID=333962 RepID=UPI00223ED5AF|nr:hypothetical protein [Providencia heimbachae]
MSKYKKLLFLKNVILIMISICLYITTESKGFNLYKEAFLFNAALFIPALFWLSISFRLVPDSGLTPKSYLQVLFTFLIFLAPLVDLLFDRAFTKASTVLFVLALTDGFYFIGAIALNIKKNLGSLRVKVIISETLNSTNK